VLLLQRNAHGKEDLLGQFPYLGTHSRLFPAILVALAATIPIRHCELVEYRSNWF
jgi:hypothetical protein